MKRGKRQVIQSSTQPQRQQNSLPEPQINYFQTLSNSQPPTQVQSSRVTQEFKIPESVQAVTKPVEQVKSNVDEMDEKKRKIQLLKQKYLKKNKPEQGKSNQSAILQKNTIIASKPQIVNKNVEVIPTKQQPKVQAPNIIKKEQPVKIPPSLNTQSQQVKKIEPSTLQTQSIQQKSKIQVSEPILSKPISSPVPETKPQVQQQNNVPSGTTQIPKPPSRIPGRNPPPPIKKTFQPPSMINQPRQPQQTYQKPQTVQIRPQQANQEASQSSVEPISQSSKPDNTSFAPPSFQTVQKPLQNQNRKVPPPPPNRNMKDLLTKKLSNPKQVPPPPVRNQTLSSNNEESQSDFNSNNFDTNLTSQTTDPQYKPVNGINKGKTIPMDDQYNNSPGFQPPFSNSNTKAKSQHIGQVNPQKFVGQWMGSPEITLKQLFPEMKQVIEFYCLNKHHTLELSSANTAFSPLIRQFVQAFLINNLTKFSQDQKKVAQTLCLNFFYSSPNQFNDIFLVLLIKLGEGYLQKYEKALQDKFERYLKKILLFKNLLLPQQLSTFVNFCLQRSLVQQTNFLEFMMLSSQNTQLITLISNTEIQNFKHSLGVLSFCKLNLKNKNLMGLYLKSISNLDTVFARHGMIQKILNHIKELQVPQNLYQFTKQLKLKLLKSYDSKNQPQERQVKGNQNQSQISEGQSKDSGLFGYFNLNKAIDKIKTSTQKALGAVQRQKKPQQEEKKDQIVYDPIKKRYVINGQIPQDQSGPVNTEETQIKQKSPPPPPPLGNRKVPPPMPGRKPGPRIGGTNRYA